MKRLCLILLWAIGFSAFAQPNLVRIEYFIDTDPGVGNGTAIPVSAQSVNLLENVPTGALAEGFHVITFRAEDEFGVWGQYESKPFFVSLSATVSQNNIVAMEYFVDTDPGLGSGTPIAFVPMINMNILENIPTGGLPEGFHLLTIRAQDENGVWGLSESKPFYVTQSTTTIVNNISAMEYFIDADPGRGSGVAIPIAPAMSLNVLENVPTDTLTLGFHVLTVRAQDENGIWGLSESKPFYVLPSQALNLVAMEYFFDSDPGVGSGIPMSVTPAPTLNVLENINTGALSDGFHVISVRAQDDRGEWGHKESKPFYINESSGVIANDIVSMEYYFDSDPGFGSGIPIALTAGISINVLENISIGALSTGVHTIHIRAQDSQGIWGLSESKAFFVDEQGRLLINYEYAIDSDPGVGLGTQQAISPPQLSTNDTLLIDTSPLALGPHNLILRVQDENLFWTKTSIVPFQVCDGATADFIATTNCFGEPTSFTDLSTNVILGDTYAWDFDNDMVVDDLTIGSTSFTYAVSGQFTARLEIDRSGCMSTQLVTVDVIATPTADAGSDQTLCEGATVNLSGSIGGSATIGTWTHDGAGSLDNPNILTPTYTPGAAETGSITFTLTTDDPPGTCLSVSSQATVTIDPVATVSAGVGASICETEVHNLSGIIGGSATSSNWTTSGDGTFDDPGSLTASYTPGPSDALAGTVDLTITTDDPVGICPVATDQITLTIDAAAFVDAGFDQSICELDVATMNGTLSGAGSTSIWSTSGDGSFDDDALLDAVYTPGPADISSGAAILTLTSDDPVGVCNAAVSQITVTIDAVPTVTAGTDFTICAADIALLSATLGGAASSSTWSTAGDGSFDNPASLTASYTPGPNDISFGSALLTITSDDPPGLCTSVSDQVTVFMDASASVIAGADISICEDATAPLVGSFGGAATGVSWSSGGDGSFDNPNSPTAIYTPGSGDILSGTVLLTINTDDPIGLCPAATDNLSLTVNSLPAATAGPDQAICSGDVINLMGTTSGSATSGVWSTSGDGTFDDPSSLGAIYTPGAADLSSGTVQLTLTPDNPFGCGTVSADQMTLDLSDLITVFAGANLEICPGNVVSLSATTTGSVSALSWSSSGTGSFSNPTTATSVYTPSVADESSGSVILSITASSPGTCPDVTSQIQLDIFRSIAVIDQSVGVSVLGSINVDLYAGGIFNTNDVLQASILQNPTKGVASVDANGVLSYTSNPGTVGLDVITVSVCNQCNQCDDANVTVDIMNVPPVITPPITKGPPGKIITIFILDAIADLNDNLDLSTLEILVQPSSGAIATLDGAGNIIVDYTGLFFTGDDALTIRICDFSGECTTEVITIGISETDIVVFNAVTPNNDGIHDHLNLQNVEFFPENVVFVYSKLGQKVWEISDYQNGDVSRSFIGFDSNGESLPAGTYYYFIQYARTKILTGFFVLSR